MPRKPRPEAAPTTPDPIEIAMEAEAHDTRADSPARGLLVDQRRLVRWQIASERAGFTLKVLTGLAGIAVALGLAGMAWSASRASGLVIKPFSVPPSLAERGVTGEAIASGLMDRMTTMGEVARTAERLQRVQGDLGQTVSLQIPQTGVSLAQVDQWLKSKLGHERVVSGEVMIGEDGRLTLAARAGNVVLPDQTGAAADLPALVQKAAEALYEREQPRSYGSYLERQGRWDDLTAVAQRMIASGSSQTRAKGYSTLATVHRQTQGLLASRTAYQRALAIDPVGVPGAPNLMAAENALGHPEAAYQLRAIMVDQVLHKQPGDTLTPESRRQRVLAYSAGRAAMIGNYGLALKNHTVWARADLRGWVLSIAPLMSVASDHAALHDVRRAETVLVNFDPEYPAQIPTRWGATIDVAAAAEDWPRALVMTNQITARITASETDHGEARKQLNAQRAMALIGLGRLDDAAAELSATPLDCQPCVVQRGRLAALQGQPHLADHWLGEAVKMAPSLPQANYEWGKLLLARGDRAGAIARFQAANVKGPNWADPLSGWGEALLAGGDFKGAATKFEAAARLAPHWGRNEMLWGEALAKQGKAAKASDHWKKAAAMFLTPAEQARLAADQKGAS